MKRLPLAAAFWTLCGTAAAEGVPEAAIELYVDTATRQIFAEPGPGRTRLGKFAQVQEGTSTAPGGTTAGAVAASGTGVPSTSTSTQVASAGGPTGAASATG